MKEVIKRGLQGIPTGIMIGQIVSIVFSLIQGNGQFVPVVPEFTEMIGNQNVAVIIQTVLTGLIGMIFSASSVIWDYEEKKMGLLKQTSLYFFINALVVIPIAYYLRWMKGTFLGFITYMGVFVIIFFVIWCINYFFWKKEVESVNKKLEK